MLTKITKIVTKTNKPLDLQGFARKNQNVPN